MGTYTITGLPNSNNSLGPVKRKLANVEAEKGETVVTNMSRGLNNIYEMYNIGGKKHSAGGTPLALPTDEEGSDGTSFIFSDSKKLIVKDPAILDYFGMKSKKPKTFAEISKSWLPKVNKSKEVLLKAGMDKVSRKSAEMNLDNAAFKIAALKLLQESMKGMEEIPNGLTPFFDKLQLDPEQVFGMGEDMASQANQIAEKTMGGIMESAKKYHMKSLKRFKKGGIVTKDKLPKDAVIHVPGTKNAIGEWYQILEGDNKGSYHKATSMSKLKQITTETDKGPIETWINASPDNLAAEATANRIIEDGIKAKTITVSGKEPNLKIHILGSFDAPFKDKIALSRVINQSGDKFRTGKYDIKYQKSTKGYAGKGAFVAGFTPKDYEKRYVFEQMRGSGMSDENAYAALEEQYKDPAQAKQNRKDFTGWLGMEVPETDEALMSDDFYKKNYGKVTSGIEAQLAKSGYRPAMGDDALSGFEHFDAFGSKQTVGFDDGDNDLIETTDDSSVTTNEKTEVKRDPVTGLPLGTHQELENPYAYRREDINSLNRAVNSRFEIPIITPWERKVELKTPDVNYVSPERAIAAKNEQVNQMMQGMQTAQNAQGMGAAASAIAGQAYGDVANTIGQYADKNVGIFNAHSGRATAIANQQAQLDAGTDNRMQEKEDRLKQNIATAVGKAKDQIVKMENTMTTNASNMYNLNLQTTQKKKDPYTGLMYTTNYKDINPSAKKPVDLASEFNAFRGQVKGLNDADALKLFQLQKTGKVTQTPEAADNIKQPGELT